MYGSRCQVFLLLSQINTTLRDIFETNNSLRIYPGTFASVVHRQWGSSLFSRYWRTLADVCRIIRGSPGSAACRPYCALALVSLHGSLTPNYPFAADWLPSRSHWPSVSVPPLQQQAPVQIINHVNAMILQSPLINASLGTRTDGFNKLWLWSKLHTRSYPSRLCYFRAQHWPQLICCTLSFRHNIYSTHFYLLQESLLSKQRSRLWHQHRAHNLIAGNVPWQLHQSYHHHIPIYISWGLSWAYEWL